MTYRRPTSDRRLTGACRSVIAGNSEVAWLRPAETPDRREVTRYQRDPLATDRDSLAKDRRPGGYPQRPTGDPPAYRRPLSTVTTKSRREVTSYRLSRFDTCFFTVDSE